MRAEPLTPGLLAGLIRPLRVGRKIAGDVCLESMRFDETGTVLEYELTGAVVVAVAARETAAASAWVTERYAVWLRAKGRSLRPEEADAVRVLLALISRNEAGYTPPSTPTRESREGGARVPTLYLVPGHLGRSTDITLRALHVMAATDHIFVEVGQGSSTRELMQMRGIWRPDTTVTEIGDDYDPQAVVRVLEEGHDVVLFGGCEGIPCFIDPGRHLVEAVAAMGARASIRSVGGASVLGTALMRATGRLDRFTFLGHLDTDHAFSLAEPLLRTVDLRLAPIIFFVPSRNMRAALLRVARPLAGRALELTLHCDLTVDTEVTVELALDDVLDDDLSLPTTYGGAVAIVRAPEPR